MADNVTIGSATGVVVSSEEVTSLNGTTVTAQQVQRTIPGKFVSDGTLLDGMGIIDRLDPVNDGITTYPLGHASTVISTATTTTIKTGSGVAAEIRVLGGTLGNVTAYDNTAGSGTVLVPTVTPAAATILLTNAGFSTGLTIVTAAATLIVVTYR